MSRAWARGCRRVSRLAPPGRDVEPDLPVWLALASAALWLAPGAAYLWTLPLLVASALLLVTPSRQRDSNQDARSWSSLWRHLVAAEHCGPSAIRDCGIRPPADRDAGLRLHRVMPSPGLMVVPPFIAAAAGAPRFPRPSLVTALCLLAVAITGGFAATAPAYTFDQPLRRHVRALQEADGTAAIWEVASIEPGLDLAPGAPGGWSRQSSAAPASIPWGRLAHPFVFRTTGPSLGPAPVDIAGFTVAPVQAGVEVTRPRCPAAPAWRCRSCCPPDSRLRARACRARSAARPVDRCLHCSAG